MLTTRGGIYFDEFSLFKTMNFIVFPLGVGITLTGINLLTYSQAKSRESLERHTL